MSMRTTLGLLAGATLLAVPALSTVAFAHPSPGMSVWGQSRYAGGSAALTAAGGVQGATHSTTQASAPMAQVEGVLTAPVAVTATTSTSSSLQSSSTFSGNVAGLIVMFGGQANVRPLLTVTTLSSVQSTATLTLASGASYTMAANATVTYQGQAYAGTMLFPGERVHLTLSQGMVTAIQLQSTSAWETYKGMSTGSVQLSYAGGTTFTAPLAASAMVRTASGTTAVASSTLTTGTLVRAVFNAQGQVVLLQETGRTKAPAGQTSTSASGRANASTKSQASSKGQGVANASPQGQSAGSTHSQASAHAQGAAHANAHAKGHGGLALGLSASASTNVGGNLGSS
ncbi:MAG: hypothetical protein M0Z54_13490 [Thermaerobacter sp.]|nr:hypothetical protein [Thermaerobacter sp.]